MAARRRTTIVVAHRLSTIMNADIIAGQCRCAGQCRWHAQAQYKPVCRPESPEVALQHGSAMLEPAL